MADLVFEIVWANSSFRSTEYLARIQELIDIAAPRTRFTMDAANDELAFHCPIGCEHWSRRFEWPWAFKAADIKTRDVILEAGGGDTEFQFLLARYAKHVVNYDHDQGPLDSSELFARSLGLNNVLCRRGDLTSIYYSDGHFDKVFCVSVIEHIENAEKAVDELWRVLKPGGRLVLTMDIVEHPNATSHYYVDLERSQRIVARWGLQVPAFPDDGLTQVGNEVNEAGIKRTNTMKVLCVAVDKPLTG